MYHDKSESHCKTAENWKTQSPRNRKRNFSTKPICTHKHLSQRPMNYTFFILQQRLKFLHSIQFFFKAINVSVICHPYKSKWRQQAQERLELPYINCTPCATRTNEAVVFWRPLHLASFHAFIKRQHESSTKSWVMEIQK